jgi:hypothetical protein
LVKGGSSDRRGSILMIPHNSRDEVSDGKWPLQLRRVVDGHEQLRWLWAAANGDEQQ